MGEDGSQKGQQEGTEKTEGAKGKGTIITEFNRGGYPYPARAVNP
jgi:hypothetical protein